MIGSEQTSELKKGRWPKHDSDMLERLVEKYGEDWKKISAEIKNRTSKQCRERSVIYLWSLILSAQMFQRMGPKWVEIADTMNGCTGLMIKNYCNNNKRKELRIGGAIRSQTPPSINATPVISNHSDRSVQSVKDKNEKMMICFVLNEL
ncbi:124_t:CDS:2 [Acaulospora morrowiae]|uniref:124_t:CDS:1 n=1 Tax=Acaulospora morrowiae TaxID=94023 RepID=A0A9N8Z761_9GLOM|nr:124_t:CDS:2 [Acaulospora morrowiae]